MLDSPPVFDHAETDKVLEKWKMLSPIKLSWIALNSNQPLDIEEGVHKL